MKHAQISGWSEAIRVAGNQRYKPRAETNVYTFTEEGRNSTQTLIMRLIQNINRVHLV